jgi:hypothetical protein
VNSRHVKCPSCGAEKEIHNPGVVTVVCEYCGTAIFWDDEKVLSAGRQAILPEGFSRLYRGATGKLKGVGFRVLGRVRYSFGKGFWDEWFVEIEDGSTGWLTEDNHEFAIQQEKKRLTLPDMANLVPGRFVMVDGIKFYIQEIGEAECTGMEGDLPIKIQTGEKYRYADGSSPDGRYVIGIEFDDDPPSVFTGKWLDYQDISMDDEGLEW